MSTTAPHPSRPRFLPISEKFRAGPPRTPAPGAKMIANPGLFLTPTIIGTEPDRALRWFNESSARERHQVLFPMSNASTRPSAWYQGGGLTTDSTPTELEELQNNTLERAPCFALPDGLPGEIEAMQILADAFLNVKEYTFTASINGDEATFDVEAGASASFRSWVDEPFPYNYRRSTEEREIRDWLSTFITLQTPSWTLTVNIGWGDIYSLASTGANERFTEHASAFVLPFITVRLVGSDSSENPPDDITVVSGGESSFIDSIIADAGEPEEDSDVTFLGRPMLTHHTGSESYSIEVAAKTFWPPDKWRT